MNLFVALLFYKKICNFAPMKNRIYAILLLLSFLIVLSHDIIPHHHDDLVLNYTHTSKHDEECGHNHHHMDGHHHSNDSKNEKKSKEHNYPFPFHQHFSASNDIYINRSSLIESCTQIRNVLFLAYFDFFRIEIFKPSNLKIDYNKAPTFLLSLICNLEAFSLRGPPAIF